MESILAVMVVITVSSVFMVVLASGTLQVEGHIDQEELESWLAGNRLYSETEAISLDGPKVGPEIWTLPEGISGMNITYRLSGNSTPILVLNQGRPPSGSVMAFQRPLLIEMDGRNVPGVMEVRAWR